MDCFEIKSLIGFFLDRSLSQDEMQELEEHLQSCPSCFAEFQHLEKLERLVSSTDFASPPDQYWLELPQRITQRLGIPKRRIKNWGLIWPIRSLIFDRKFQFGFATATAIAVLLYTFIEISVPEEPEPIQISLKQDSSEEIMQEKEVRVADPTSEANSLPSENLIPKQSVKNEFELESVASSMPLSTEVRIDKQILITQIFADRELLELDAVAAKPIRFVSRELLTSGQQIFPVPFTDYIPPRQVLPLDDDDDPILRTFALDTRKIRAPKGSEAMDLPAEVKSIRSGFLETLRIVHESSSLEEKKNIWLSYISRESDFTYKHLGIYNLAPVLTKIAEKNKSFDSAYQARRFFREHEKSLRFHMGSEQFNDKMKFFESIVKM